MPKQNLDTSKINHGDEVLEMSLVSHNKPAKVLQPAKKNFDLPTPMIPPRGSAILHLGLFSPLSLRSNHFGASTLEQTCIEFVAV